MTQLRPVNHQIIVNSVEKVAPTSFDDKHYLLDGGVHSLAYGQYATPESSEGNIYSVLANRKKGKILLFAQLARSTTYDDSGAKSDSEISPSTSRILFGLKDLKRRGSTV